MSVGLTPHRIVNSLSGIGGGLDLRTVQAGPTQLGHFAGAQQTANPIYVHCFDAATPGEVFSDATMAYTRQPKQTFIIPGNTAGAGSNIQVGGGLVPSNGLTFNDGLVIGFSTAIVATGASGLTETQVAVANFGVK